MRPLHLPQTVRSPLAKPARTERHVHRARREPHVVEVAVYRGMSASLAREYRARARRERRLREEN